MATTQRRWNRLALAILGAGLVCLLAAGVLIGRMILDDGNSGVGTSTPIGNVNAIQTPAPSPTAPPSEAPIAHLAIPRFGIDAPVIVLGVDANNVMEAPDGPEDVAWYDFSRRPGFGSNAVFSGHVDWAGYGPAVFYNLKDLELGDIIQVRLQDGTVYDYSVINRENVGSSPTQEQLDQIVGSTPNEIITLITCGGTFDSSIGEYDQRVIVRAERVRGDTPPSVSEAN
jgi:LPXTG-site transpeptidase (sortase) family protein